MDTFPREIKNVYATLLFRQRCLACDCGHGKSDCDEEKINAIVKITVTVVQTSLRQTRYIAKNFSNRFKSVYDLLADEFLHIWCAASDEDRMNGVELNCDDRCDTNIAVYGPIGIVFVGSYVFRVFFLFCKLQFFSDFGLIQWN